MTNESSYLSTRNKRKPSKALMDMINAGVINGSVLDYGCGKGVDMDYLTIFKPDTIVSGYDPVYFPILTNKKYDTIFCNNVINYIKDSKEIYLFLLKARKLLNNNGKLILIARSIAEVKGNVNRNDNWKYLDKFNGYYSVESDIFQRGYDTNELVGLIEDVGLIAINDQYDIKPVAYSYVIAEII